jgi:hypothetical protein
MFFWIVRYGTYKTGSSRRSGLSFYRVVRESMDINLEHPSLSPLQRGFGCLFLLN